MDSPHQLLPIFPLTEVLFPHSRVQVHVTNPVHQELVKTCLRDKTPFGACFSRGGDDDLPYLVGTFATVRNSVHFEDGRIDITIDGGARFRIRAWDESSSILKAQYEMLEDESPSDPAHLDHLATEVRELYERMLRKQIEHQDLRIDVLFPAQPTQLAFSIVSMLSVTALQKQYLLELTDPITRIQTLLEHLREDPTSYDEPLTRLRAVDLREYNSPN